MSIDEFWQIVDGVHTDSKGDMDAKCELLAARLSDLPLIELQSFADHFTDLSFRAYKFELWDAADIINGGCGDDSFHDFRSTLISMGRQIYESGVSEPDSLADYEVLPGMSTFEGYQYVCGKVFEKIHKNNPSVQDRQRAGRRQHPAEPTGTATHPWERCARFPKLTAKFGYRDSDFFNEKIRFEKHLEQCLRVERFANILLGAEIVTPNGWIPPMVVARYALGAGCSPQPRSKINRWEPIELAEEDFWALVVYLERLSPDQLKNWPHIRAAQLQLDVETMDKITFEGWVISLKNRNVF